MTSAEESVLVPKRLSTVEEDGIRRFLDPDMQAEMDRIAASLPPGNRGLVLEVLASKGPDHALRIGQVAAVKLGSDFSVMQAFVWDKPNGAKLSLSLRWSK